MGKECPKSSPCLPGMTVHWEHEARVLRGSGLLRKRPATLRCDEAGLRGCADPVLAGTCYQEGIQQPGRSADGFVRAGTDSRRTKKSHYVSGDQLRPGLLLRRGRDRRASREDAWGDRQRWRSSHFRLVTARAASIINYATSTQPAAEAAEQVWIVHRGRRWFEAGRGSERQSRGSDQLRHLM